MKKGLKCSYLTKIGIFSIFAFVTAVSVYIYSPIVASNATDGIITHVDATIHPSASVSLSENELIFDISPATGGTFESKSVVVTTDTNSSGGYELYFSAEDDNTDMVYTEDGITDKIVSNFSGTVTSDSMPSNTWGYSLDGTDFTAIPTATNQHTLMNINHYPSASDKEKSLYIGTKIAPNLLAGIYSKNLIFSVIVHDPLIEEEVDPTPVVTMQTFNKTSLANVGDLMRLVDERDGKYYTVKKLADGNVWMVDSLRIMNQTISSEGSNLPDGETWTIPEGTSEAFMEHNKNEAYLDNKYGGYYSFYTATAGWGTGAYNNSEDVIKSGNSPKDICPKGWRLPTGGNSSDTSELFRYYDSSELLQGDPGFKLGGYHYYRVFHLGGFQGYYWTSTVRDASTAVTIFVDGANSQYEQRRISKYEGMQIHCIAN